MKQQYLLPLLFFLLPITACVSTHKSTKPSLVHPEKPHQSPSVVAPKPTPQPAATDNVNVEKINSELVSIESEFIAQNCDSVLEHTKKLQALYPNNDFTRQPPIIQAAVYTCDAKAGLGDANRVKLAVTNLKTLSLRYPFINEAWVHNTLADFYITLNNTSDALTEKKQARDLLVAQQQDITSLNVEIAKLDPSSQAIANPQTPPSQLPITTPPQTVEQIISSATQLVNNDSPEQAISLLDTIPTVQRTENSKRIRKEAVNNLVTNLRFKVRALFVRSTEQTGQVKKDSLSQCEQILKGIIQNYPEYQDMASVQNNLKQVQRELNRN